MKWKIAQRDFRELLKTIKLAESNKNLKGGDPLNLLIALKNPCIMKVSYAGVHGEEIVFSSTICEWEGGSDGEECYEVENLHKATKLLKLLLNKKDDFVQFEIDLHGTLFISSCEHSFDFSTFETPEPEEENHDWFFSVNVADFYQMDLRNFLMTPRIEKANLGSDLIVSAGTYSNTMTFHRLKIHETNLHKLLEENFKGLNLIEGVFHKLSWNWLKTQAKENPKENLFFFFNHEIYEEQEKTYDKEGREIGLETVFKNKGRVILALDNYSEDEIWNKMQCPLRLSNKEIEAPIMRDNTSPFCSMDKNSFCRAYKNVLSRSEKGGLEFKLSDQTLSIKASYVPTRGIMAKNLTGEDQSFCMPSYALNLFSSIFEDTLDVQISGHDTEDAHLCLFEDNISYFVKTFAKQTDDGQLMLF